MAIIDEECFSSYYLLHINISTHSLSAKADLLLMDDGHSSHYSQFETDQDEVPPLAGKNKIGELR